MELAKKVLHPYDIVNELDSYVNFLSEKFRPAISEVNKRNGNYQIVDNLTVGDIYRNYDLGLIDFSNINIQNFDVVIDQLRSTISVNHETIFLQEILDNTMQVYVRWVSPEFECFNESKNSFFWECDEPSSRVFEALINLYLNRIYFLIGELARNDFENYWNLLFEYHGMSLGRNGNFRDEIIK